MNRPTAAASAVSDSAHLEGYEVRVGGLSRPQLLASLSSHGVHLNVHAETLLASEAFDGQAARPIVVSERTVAELGFAHGAPLSRIFEAARQQGMSLCPSDAGPYLRLAVNEQMASSDSVMSAGHAPEGALTVASAPMTEDDEFPKGFYLRVVDGQSWLRGYRCDDEYIWSPHDRFIFRQQS